MPTTTLEFPADRAVGFVVFVDPKTALQRVEAQGSVPVPPGVATWFTCGAMPVTAGDLASLPPEAFGDVLVAGPHADSAVVAMARAGIQPQVLTLGAGVTDIGMGALPAFVRLRALTIESSAISDTGFAVVAALSSLTSLVLGVKRAHVPGEPEYAPPAVGPRGLSACAGLVSLESLVLGLQRVEATSCAVLGQLPRLTTVTMTRANLDGPCLVALSRAPLETLSLPSSVLEDDAMAVLASLATLTSVSFDAGRVSRGAIAGLRAALPAATVNGEWLSARAVAKHLAAAER